MFLPGLLVAAYTLVLQSPVADGVVGGVVVNAADQTPVGGAEVVLRQYVDGDFLPVATTTTDSKGMYYFRNLAADGAVYQSGAKRGGVYYPAEKVQLTQGRPVAGVKVEVCDPLTEPCPLLVRRHDIEVEPLEGMLRVREVLEIENPGKACYVGKVSDDGGEPVTLQLSIPTDFIRATFDREFYGRRFSLRSGKLLTSIPWTPGVRELGFTYLLPNDKRHVVWNRSVDLPTQRLRIVVSPHDSNTVSCNTGTLSSGDDGATIYTVDTPIGAGHAIRLELGRLPMPWMAYARWIALATLVALLVCASVAMRRSGATGANQPAAPVAGARRRRRSRADAVKTASASQK